MIYIGYVRPYALPQANWTETANETLTLLSTYVLFLFTDFVPDPSVRYTTGWALIVITLSIVVLNITIMALNTIYDLKFSAKKKL